MSDSTNSAQGYEPLPFYQRAFYTLAEIATFHSVYIWNRDDESNLQCHPNHYISYEHLITLKKKFSGLSDRHHNISQRHGLPSQSEGSGSDISGDSGGGVSSAGFYDPQLQRIGEIVQDVHAVYGAAQRGSNRPRPRTLEHHSPPEIEFYIEGKEENSSDSLSTLVLLLIVLAVFAIARRCSSCISIGSRSSSNNKKQQWQQQL